MVDSRKRFTVFLWSFCILTVLMLLPSISLASWLESPANYQQSEPLTLLGIPVDFVLFALTLLGVALFHHFTLRVALIGLTVVVMYKLIFIGFKFGPGIPGLIMHLSHEWVVLANLFGLLMGFALLSDHFERSHIPAILPKYLKGGWVGAFLLLVIIFVLSSFLDNIAAALIGGTIANIVFERKVHIGYVAGIVAASNAGGSGSVLGDTTTTMMWIAGHSPASVFHAYVGAVVALVVCGIPAAIQQNRYAPLVVKAGITEKVDGARLSIVFFILALAVTANVLANAVFIGVADHWPILGATVWIALLASAPLRMPNWSLLPENFKSSVFLLCLVTIASLMPVEKLPPASWESAMALGFVSAVFDNIPLTALALSQGGFDWGMLAYAVGFGGSMIWFGSSAGVAITNLFPQARSVGGWVRHGWHVAVAYILGFLVLVSIMGWHPTVSSRQAAPAAPALHQPGH